MKLVKGIALVSAASLLAACGSDSDDGEASINYPSTYEFASKFDANESAVAYPGQTARQLLIEELKKATGNVEVTQAELEDIYTVGLTALDEADIYGAESETSVSLTLPDGFTFAQANYTQVLDGAGSKKLSDKTAGCDNELSASQFIGWDPILTALEDCSVANGNNAVGTDYNDAPYSLMLSWLNAAAVNPVDESLGLNYAQLFQKFMLGAVTFSQTSEDYLKKLAGKDNIENYKGNSDNPYTALGHAWDEGFGYFGASVDYLSIADEDINSKINHSDVNGDYVIDLLGGEYNYGLAQYASKHDVMTQTTDLSKEIMVAFLEGRQLILDNHGTTPQEGDAFHTRLTEIADRAINGMEKVIAISVVKYLNLTLNDLSSFALGQTAVDDLAKHWSELKGFALGLQFDPTPTLTEAQQVRLHEQIGVSPIDEVRADKDAYVVALTAARTTVQQAYGFDIEASSQWGL